MLLLLNTENRTTIDVSQMPLDIQIVPDELGDYGVHMPPDLVLETRFSVRNTNAEVLFLIQ